MKKIILLLLLVILVACNPYHNAKTTYHLNEDMKSGKVITTIKYPKHSEEKYSLQDIKTKIDNFYKSYQKPIELKYESKIEKEEILFTFSFDFNSLEDYKTKIEKLTGSSVEVGFKKSENPFDYSEKLEGFNGQLDKFIKNFEKSLDEKKVFEEKVSNFLNYEHTIFVNGKEVGDKIENEYPVEPKNAKRELTLAYIPEQKDKKEKLEVEKSIDTIIYEQNDKLIENLNSGLVKNYYSNELGFEVDVQGKKTDQGVEIVITYDKSKGGDFEKYNDISFISTSCKFPEILEPKKPKNKLITIETNSEKNIDFITKVNLKGLEFTKNTDAKQNPNIVSLSKKQIEIKGRDLVTLIVAKPKSFLSYIPWIAALATACVGLFFAFKNRLKIKDSLSKMMKKQEKPIDDNAQQIKIDEEMKNNLDFKKINSKEILNDFKIFLKNPMNLVPSAIYITGFLITLIISQKILLDNLSKLLSFSSFSDYLNGFENKITNIIAASFLSFGKLNINGIMSINASANIKLVIVIFIPIILSISYLIYQYKNENKPITIRQVFYYSFINTITISLIYLFFFNFTIDIQIIKISITNSLIGNLFIGLIVNFVFLFILYVIQNKYRHTLIETLLSTLKLTFIISLFITLILILSNGENIKDMLLASIFFVPNIILIFMASLSGLMITISSTEQISINATLQILRIVSIITCILISTYAVGKIRTYYKPEQKTKAIVFYATSTLTIMFAFGHLSSIIINTQGINNFVVGIDIKSLLVGSLLIFSSMFTIDYFYDRIPVFKIVETLDKILSFKFKK